MLVVDAVSEYLQAHANEVSDAVTKSNEEAARKFREMANSAHLVQQQTRRSIATYYEHKRLVNGFDSISKRFPDDEPAFAQIPNEQPAEEDVTAACVDLLTERVPDVDFAELLLLEQ